MIKPTSDPSWLVKECLTRALRRHERHANNGAPRSDTDFATDAWADIANLIESGSLHIIQGEAYSIGGPKEADEDLEAALACIVKTIRTGHSPDPETFAKNVLRSLHSLEPPLYVTRLEQLA